MRLGYGVIDGEGASRLSYVECGVISAPASASRAGRLLSIGRSLREVIEELRPHEVAMEQAFFGKNVQSTLALGEARGMVTFLVGEAGLSLTGYTPAKVKQSVVGHGTATKQQVGFLVKALLSLKRVPDADAADALAIAICHARLANALALETRPKRRAVRG